MRFETDIVVTLMDNSEMVFENIHPDSQPKVEDGLLTFESLSGDQIHYLPAVNVKNFYSICVERR